MTGGVNILKPAGWSSSDAVVKVRGILRSYCQDKKIKVGHGGTLDPGACGVLPILFGKATGLFDYRLGGRKLYRARFVFGSSTDTLDSYSETTHKGARIPEYSEIVGGLSGFIGEIDQVPPRYSSVSVGGVRAYAAARRGQELILPSRRVKIFSIEPLSYDCGVLELDISCGGGTYIRSLCRDIAAALGTAAYMSLLIRLEDRDFAIEDSHTIEEFSDNPEACIIGIDELIRDEPRVDIGMELGSKLINGVRIAERGVSGFYSLYIDGRCYGICRDCEGAVKTAVRLWE